MSDDIQIDETDRIIEAMITNLESVMKRSSQEVDEVGQQLYLAKAIGNHEKISALQKRLDGAKYLNAYANGAYDMIKSAFDADFEIPELLASIANQGVKS